MHTWIGAMAEARWVLPCVWKMWPKFEVGNPQMIGYEKVTVDGGNTQTYSIYLLYIYICITFIDIHTYSSTYRFQPH